MQINSLAMPKHRVFSKIWRLKATLSYIVFIVLINKLFILLPFFSLFSEPVSPLDISVGMIYVFRDFAQREIKHYIFIAMILAGILSFVLADHTIALASVMAFMAGELIDWGIFTFTRKPLSQRLLWSAMVSAPIDSYIFLYMLNRANAIAWSVMTVAKLIGVLLVWLSWKRINRIASVSIDNTALDSRCSTSERVSDYG